MGQFMSIQSLTLCFSPEKKGKKTTGLAQYLIEGALKDDIFAKNVKNEKEEKSETKFLRSLLLYLIWLSLKKSILPRGHTQFSRQEEAWKRRLVYSSHFLVLYWCSSISGYRQEPSRRNFQEESLQVRLPTHRVLVCNGQHDRFSNASCVSTAINYSGTLQEFHKPLKNERIKE